MLPVPVKPVGTICCCIWYFFPREWDFFCHLSFPPEARGCLFPSLDVRRAYVELISFAFPYPCIPLLTPARPAAGRPWCCLARRAASLPTATLAQLPHPALVHNSRSSIFCWQNGWKKKNGPVPGSSSWGS